MVHSVVGARHFGVAKMAAGPGSGLVVQEEDSGDEATGGMDTLGAGSRPEDLVNRAVED